MATDITALVRASTFFTADADADITDGETVVIGGKTYTFKATLTDTDGFVQLGTAGDRVESMQNLEYAMNLTGTAGTHYAASMTQNAYCYGSYPGSGDVFTIYARAIGAVGNLIPVTIGTSAVVLDNATCENGAGSIDTLVNELQAGFQLNSALQRVLEYIDHGTA
jgi:hypothetical protein